MQSHIPERVPAPPPRRVQTAFSTATVTQSGHHLRRDQACLVNADNPVLAGERLFHRLEGDVFLSHLPVSSAIEARWLVVVDLSSDEAPVFTATSNRTSNSNTNMDPKAKKPQKKEGTTCMI